MEIGTLLREASTQKRQLFPPEDPIQLRKAEIPSFHWEKRGLLLAPPFDHANAVSHAAIPFLHETAGPFWKLYFASRDAQSRSRTFVVKGKWTANGPVLTGRPRLVLDLGEIGAFDDSGVMPSWVVDAGDGRQLLYYSGWNVGVTVPFYFYIGLAVSRDGGRSFRRHSRAPILGRSSHDPFLTASPCVLREGKRWRMWYVSGDRWEKDPAGVKHYYNLRYAESKNGLDWVPQGRVCIDFGSREEYAFARPCVVKVQGGYVMWYAVRGTTYRMGMAWSRDGLTWIRRDENVGLSPSAEGWDSEMVAYAHVVSRGSDWYAFYNGNGYGRSGIGVARGAMTLSR